jgi:hypothetical protein
MLKFSGYPYLIRGLLDGVNKNDSKEGGKAGAKVAKPMGAGKQPIHSKAKHHTAAAFQAHPKPLRGPGMTAQHPS